MGELAAVYIKYAAANKLQYELLESSESSCTLHIRGSGCWELFAQETGKHCVQRVGTTESQGRIHTSYVSCAVLSLPPSKDERLISESELDISFQKGHGKGGQHQNTTDSACRIKHKRTGIMVFINGRDQHANRRNAIRIISAKVNELELAAQHQKRTEERKILADGGRGDKVRTYNFQNCRVVDHRTGKKTKNIKGVMKGQLELIL